MVFIGKLCSRTAFPHLSCHLLSAITSVFSAFLFYFTNEQGCKVGGKKKKRMEKTLQIHLQLYHKTLASYSAASTHL